MKQKNLLKYILITGLIAIIAIGLYLATQQYLFQPTTGEPTTVITTPKTDIGSGINATTAP